VLRAVHNGAAVTTGEDPLILPQDSLLLMHAIAGGTADFAASARSQTLHPTDDAPSPVGHHAPLGEGACSRQTSDVLVRGSWLGVFQALSDGGEEQRSRVSVEGAVVEYQRQHHRGGD
jgi:hypothetical protein